MDLGESINKKNLDIIETEILWDDLNSILISVQNEINLQFYEILNLTNLCDIIDYISYYYKDQHKIIDFLETTLNLPIELKEGILEYLIIKGFQNFLWYSEIGGIDINKVCIQLIKKGKFELFLLIKNQNPNISKSELIESLYKFINSFQHFDLYEKMHFLLSYEYFLIIEELLDYDQSEINNLFNKLKLTESDINFLILIKDRNLNLQYIEYIENLKNNILKQNTIILESIFSTINSNTKNIHNFNQKLTEILISQNGFNIYYVSFISINGMEYTFSLEPFNVGSYGNNTFFDSSLFINEILKVFSFYKKNLEENNMEFTIIISKFNGNKSPSPSNDEQIENSDFTKVA